MDRVTAQVNVAYASDFVAALAALDRSQFGETGYRVFQSEIAPNVLMAEFDWIDLAAARVFWSSKSGKDHIATWRSVHAPQWAYWLGAQ